jgi:glycosyltransferase involved in cell wall biosynthesis
MTTYNGEKYLKSQLDSILYQLGNSCELIICDDKSNDQTIEILREYESIDNRVRLYFNTQNLGHMRNFSKALAYCKNEYIFMVDQDDIWIDKKVEIMLTVLTSDSKIMCVVSNAEIINSEGVVTNPSYFSITNGSSGLVRNFVKNSFLGCCMAFRKEVLDYALPIPAETKTHDTWIGLVSELLGKTVFINDVLLKYRRHDSNTSKMSSGNLLAILSIRFHLFVNLIRVFLQHKGFIPKKIRSEV